jgi:hypothetical protein
MIATALPGEFVLIIDLISSSRDREGNPEACKVLLDADVAAVATVSHNGRSPLHTAGTCDPSLPFTQLFG